MFHNLCPDCITAWLIYSMVDHSGTYLLSTQAEYYKYFIPLVFPLLASEVLPDPHSLLLPPLQPA